MDKGQMWSVDVIIGIVIFISILTVFYTTLAGSSGDVTKALQKNADTVLTKFTQDPDLKVITPGNVLNNSKLVELSNLPYQELKAQLGIAGDFCIYLEDENGRIIPIGGKNGLGSSDINISGTPCGDPVI